MASIRERFAGRIKNVGDDGNSRTRSSSSANRGPAAANRGPAARGGYARQPAQPVQQQQQIRTSSSSSSIIHSSSSSNRRPVATTAYEDEEDDEDEWLDYDVEPDSLSPKERYSRGQPHEDESEGYARQHQRISPPCSAASSAPRASAEERRRRAPRRELPKRYVASTEEKNEVLRGALANEKLIKQPKDQLFYSKKARPVNFEPYTLEDYRQVKPEKYYELGKLKPDLQSAELLAKRSNADRVKEFSRKLRDVNVKEAARAPPRRREETKAESKREKAAAFAKNIPKPKAVVAQPPAARHRVKTEPPPSHFEADDDYYNDNDTRSRRVGSASDDHSSSSRAAPSRLDQLEARHDELRNMADDIRRQYKF